MRPSFPHLAVQRLIVSLLLLGVTVTLHGAVYHVTPNGNDRNPGSAERPLASLAGARDAVRASGLRDGDLIYACNSEAVKSVYDLGRIISTAPADQPLTLLLRREGKGGIKVVLPSCPMLPKRS